jgi:hypothetical protein
MTLLWNYDFYSKNLVSLSPLNKLLDRSLCSSIEECLQHHEVTVE